VMGWAGRQVEISTHNAAAHLAAGAHHGALANNAVLETETQYTDGNRQLCFIIETKKKNR
jgi:hypothetical protein